MSKDVSCNQPQVLILGVGNLLWADEGFGVRAVEAFSRAFTVPDTVSVMDGGTQGLLLIPDLAAASHIIIFDAVDFDADPGSMVVVHGDEVPKFAAGKKVSLHQTSMMEVLALADVMEERETEDIMLIGCQPADMEDYGGGLTPLVAAKVAPALEAARKQLLAWGIPLSERAEGEAEQHVMPHAINQAAYEGGRPSADDACRIGDDRVLALSAGNTLQMTTGR